MGGNNSLRSIAIAWVVVVSVLAVGGAATPAAATSTLQTQSDVTTVMMVDDSGSMSGEKMSNAKTAAQLYTSLSPDSDSLGIVGFDSDARVEQSVVQLGSGRADVESAIDGLDAGGGTHIGNALLKGADELDDDTSDNKKVGILLSDGRGPADVSEVVERYNSRNYCLYTVAFGDGADEELLKDLASQVECGGFFSAPDGDSLREVYNQINQEVSNKEVVKEDSGTLEAGNTASGTFDIPGGTSQATVRVSTSTSSNGNSKLISPAAAGAGMPKMRSAGHRFGAAGRPTAVAASSGSITLRDPDGNEVTAEDGNVQKDTVGDSTIYRIDNPQPGEWSYELHNTDTEPLSFEIEITIPGDPVSSGDGNVAPNLDVTPRITARSGETVTLDVADAEDPDGRIESYEWETGWFTDIELEQNGSSPTATFTAPDVPGRTTLTFQLTVTDNQGTEIDKHVQVFVEPAPNGTDAGSADGTDSATDRGTVGDSQDDMAVVNVTYRDTDGDGEEEPVFPDRDGDGDGDPTRAEFETAYPDLDYDRWRNLVA